MQVPDEDWNRFKGIDLKLRGTAENLDHTRAALAMCENLDANIGRLLKSLDEPNTIVVYFHDNGPNGKRWNGGMKGVKGSTDEGGVRSPLFIRWPGTIKESVVKPIAGAIDLLPTIAELCGVTHVGTAPLDGISFAPALLSGAMFKSERLLFAHWNGRTSARSQSHRLDAAGQLFDMVNDPGQTKAVADPLRGAALRTAVEAWKADALAGIAKTDDRPFPVGWREMPRTVLPARDGVPLGAVKRSANAPNCSYFTNWTTAKDAMTWVVEVETAGRYEAILHYTSGEVGSTLELSPVSYTHLTLPTNREV